MWPITTMPASTSVSRHLRRAIWSSFSRADSREVVDRRNAAQRDASAAFSPDPERYGAVRAYLSSYGDDVSALVDELDSWSHYIGRHPYAVICIARYRVVGVGDSASPAK